MSQSDGVACLRRGEDLNDNFVKNLLSSLTVNEF